MSSTSEGDRQHASSLRAQSETRSLLCVCRCSRWKKRGLAVVPTKYCLAFGVAFLNQGGALLHVYTDGSVLLTHGGMEMGQGLHTKMVQVCVWQCGEGERRLLSGLGNYLLWCPFYSRTNSCQQCPYYSRTKWQCLSLVFKELVQQPTSLSI